MQVIVERNSAGEVSIRQNLTTLAVMSHAKFKREFGFRLPKDSADKYQLSLKLIERQVDN